MATLLPALLAGLIDERTFLSAELTSFGAVDFLNGRAGSTDLVLSFGAWPISYAPFPAQMNHVYRNAREYTAADLAELERKPCRFLILPAAGNLADLEKAAAALRPIRFRQGDPISACTRCSEPGAFYQRRDSGA